MFADRNGTGEFQVLKQGSDPGRIRACFFAFPQHIAVTMATAVLRVATGARVRDVERRREDKRWGERERKNKDGCE